MKPIIEINNLFKKYKYGELKPYYTLRDTLTDIAKAPLRFFQRKGSSLKKDEFWVLKDISFKVNPGETIGIIGSNGAGKSTLLKVLSRITPPTRGEGIIRGRIGSLLEVGTGFQQELTGRENIYLNGAILGMTRKEIDRKFDDIFEFSGVGKFLDTPVKFYSSGMYMRLAFAVAAHLDPEILLIDEVLAVGDAAFQKKCINKMEDISKSDGKTIFFVSHNMSAISLLCKRCLFIDKGVIEYDGPTDKAIEKYLETTRSLYKKIDERSDRSGTGLVRLKSIRLQNSFGKEVPHVKINEPFSIVLQIGSGLRNVIKNIFITLQITDEFGNTICSISNEQYGLPISLTRNKTITCNIQNGLSITPGRYLINFTATILGIKADKLDRVCEFQIVSSDFFGTKALPDSAKGILLIKSLWQ